VDLYGATFGAAMGITLSGTLVTHGSSSAGADHITGSLTNNGSIVFADYLHTLAISSSYTQGSTGSLTMRIQDPANGVSDQLTAGTIAHLDGTLTVNAQGTLPANGEWTIITTHFGLGGTGFANEYPPTGFVVADDGFNVYIEPPPN
jgi:hypothetical protein